MKILMILQSDFPPDIRIEKEAQTLLAESHTIDLICNNYKNLPMEDTYSGIKIYRLMNMPFSKIINLPFFLNPLWFYKIYSLIISTKPDVIHVHDLPLFLTGAFFGKLFGITTIFDMHENYPAMLKATKGTFTFKSACFATIIERIAIRIADYIIVVIEEQLERLMKLGVPRKKIVIVSNTVDLKTFRSLRVDLKIKQELNAAFYPIISYVGELHGRGLETVLQAIHILSSKLPNFRLLLVGNGKGKMALEKTAENLGIKEKIDFKGWVRFDAVPSYINASTICLVPHPANPHINTTIPHKLFQYMALGKPVIVTDAKPLARIVNECKCGIVVKSHDANALADAIIKLSDKEFASRLGKNGMMAVENTYNWENTSKDLINLYKQL